jgi:tetratricopeptide (TPR) repeat protein
VKVGQSNGPWAVEAYDALGKMKESLGASREAAEAYRLALARPGAEADRRTAIQIELAHVLDDLGDPSVTDVYATLLTAPDAAVRVQARIAVAEREMGTDPAKARDLCGQALEEAGAGEARAEARACWLRASVASGHADDGLEQLSAWLHTESDAAARGDLALAAVKALHTEGRLEDAKKLGETYAEDGGFELGMELSAVYRDLGDPGAAADLLAKLKAGSAEDDAWLLETRADALLDKGDLDAAQSAYEALAKTPGGAAAARFGLARIFRERGDFNDAYDLLKDSTDERAAVERATILQEKGDYEGAETAWRRIALSEDLGQRSAGVVGLATVLAENGDAQGALAELDTLPVLDPGYRLSAAQVRADALLALHRVRDARDVYKSLTADAESRTVSLLGQGDCALADNDPPSALDLYQRAYDGTSDAWYRAKALSGEINAYLVQGRQTEARTTLAQLKRDHADRADLISAAEAALAAPP